MHRYSKVLPLDIRTGTTTLNVTITREANPAQRWKGALRIHLTDLVTQMWTLRTWRAVALIRRSTWTELLTFLSIFAAQTWCVYWRWRGDRRLKAPTAPARKAGHQTLSYSSHAEGTLCADGRFTPMQFYHSTAAGELN